jgi:hypothetical protein
VVLDLVASGARQRFAELRSPGRRPRGPLLVAVVLFVALSVVVGGPHLLPLGIVAIFPVLGLALFVLPAVGIVLLRSAWLRRRVVGARPWLRVAAAAACFVPGVWWALVTDDSGYWVAVALILALIHGLVIGAIAAITALVQGRQTGLATGRKVGSIVMITAAVVILGAMAGAGFNSYLNSRPPAGDHSPANASPDSRALWDAADAGDVETVVATIEACADPFVHFDDGGRARSNAEFWAGLNHSGRDPVAEPMLSRYVEIVERLHLAEDTWTERCNS